ncbi:MAG: hypothetical protein WC943_17820, partial [Elusimicrobiota bacterium]
MLEAWLLDPPSLPEILRSVTGVAAAFAAVFSAGFSLFSAVCAGLVLRSGARADAEPFLPPVTVLKPLKGRDRGLYQNLASFCGQ